MNLNTNTKNFAESAKGFTKSPLGIIALFIVLVYGFATLAVTFSNNLSEYISPLIYFLVSFPFFVFIGFLWLVAYHHTKIYGPSDFKSDEAFNNFTSQDVETIKSLILASIKESKVFSNAEIFQPELTKIIDLVSKNSIQTNFKLQKNKKKILWVDDRPENNIFQRKVFEAQGIKFDLALNTDEAIEKIRSTIYSAIISDMGRKEGPREGYVLLEKIRSLGFNIPFFIYAGSNSIEHKILAKKKGAQGSTNSTQELFEMIMSTI